MIKQDSREAVFPSKKTMNSFIDRKLKENELEIVLLFINSLEETVNTNGDDKIFDLTRMMQMMISDNEALRNNCLTEGPGSDSHRNNLAKIIGIFSSGNEENLRSMIERSEVLDKFNLCSENGRVTIKDFAVRTVMYCVEENYNLFNDGEKKRWIEQVGLEPDKLFQDFHHHDNIKRAELSERIERLLESRKREMQHYDDRPSSKGKRLRGEEYIVSSDSKQEEENIGDVASDFKKLDISNDHKPPSSCKSQSAKNFVQKINSL